MSRLVGVQRDYYHVADDILAIEEEAVAARESEIRAAVEGMYDKREEAPWGLMSSGLMVSPTSGFLPSSPPPTPQL